MLFWSIVSGVYLLFKVILLLGILYENLAGAVERRKYPPPGQMIPVGDHQLHVWVSGSGSGPTVLLEGGAGTPAILLSRIRHYLGPDVRVCLYDRAGYGWSDRAKSPRTGEAVVHELHTLLHEAAVPGPYIIVGHSLGGMYARLYAHRYPGEVVGLVLVEARHEEITRRQPRLLKWIAPLSYIVMLYLSFLGLTRLLVRVKPGLLTGGRDLIQEHPAELQPVIRMQISRPRLFLTANAEVRRIPQLDEALRAAGDLGDLPLTVMTGARNGASWGAFQRVWRETQAQLAGLSRRSRHILVDDAGHGLPMERPDLVAAAIREMMAGIQR